MIDMLTITFRNDGTGDKATGNYDVTVTVNGLVIYRGRVERHDRRMGWEQLLRDFIGQLGQPPGEVVFIGKPCDNLSTEDVTEICTT